MLVGAETLPPGKQKPACISDAQYILIKGKRCDRFNLFNLHSSPFFAFFFQVGLNITLTLGARTT